MTIVAAADGSALGNPGPAGWAWYVDDQRWASGGWPRGTNNMGELMAVLDLLRQTARAEDDLLVYCDSLYVINTVTQWMAGWKRRGWRKKDGKPVLNVELVQAIDEALVDRVDRRVRFEWVKGHAGHPLNEEADRLAVAAATAYRQGRAPEAGPGFGGGADRLPPPALGGSPVLEDDLFSAHPPESAPAGPALVPRTPVEEVVALERALLSDPVRSDREAVASLLDPRWTELGASGRSRTREDLLSTLPAEVGTADLEVLSVEPVTPDVVLLLGRERSDRGATLRSSVWVRSDGRWRQRFRQGTPEGGSHGR